MVETIVNNYVKMMCEVIVIWYVHITRSTGVAKMIPPGTVQGESRKGRQIKKRWEDNIILGWTGLGLGEALRKAEDREEWRKVVAR